MGCADQCRERQHLAQRGQRQQGGVVAGVGHLVVQALEAAAQVQHLPHRGAGLGHGQRMVHDVAHRHTAPPGQRMAGCHQHHDGRRLVVFNLQALFGGHGEFDPQVDLAAQQVPAHFVGRAHLQLNAAAGLGRAERGHDLRHETTGQALGAGDADEAGALPAQPFDFVDHAFGIQHGGAHIGGQPLPGSAERHAAGLALEQGAAQLVFQFADLAADGRYRHMQLLGRLRHRAGAGDLQKVAAGCAQQGQGHGLAFCVAWLRCRQRNSGLLIL